MKWMILVLVSLIISGCGSISAYSAAKEECESGGGELIACEANYKDLSGYTCSFPTGDGGEPCSDSSECEAECVAPYGCVAGTSDVEGTCAESTALVCYGLQKVEDGTCGDAYAA
tara:strand:- start:1643 stop:1987 length:345 start_codon:yes stop_codon:yes gene_type:complete